MPEPTPADLHEVGDYRNWTPLAQAKALELLKDHTEGDWRPFYCPNPLCDGNPHGDWAWPHARPDQRPPRWADDWLTLLLSGGRGSGKTRTGSEITHRVTERIPRVGLVAATGYDLRETMVEGISGILATAPPGKRPLWEPSKKKLTWPNGCIGQGFSAEEPDRLRGPETGFCWADEPAHYDNIDTVWANMKFGLRLKCALPPKIIATSTPKPIPWLKDLIADPKTIVHRASTYANLANLADVFKADILDRYEGTRLGRQELYGELLEDVIGALWSWEMFSHIDYPPHLDRVVVAVDPAGTATARSDETGIIVLGIAADRTIYVLSDRTGKYSPAQWGDLVLDEAETHLADAIVAEKNYGGDMVRYVLDVAAEKRKRLPPKIKTVNSRRGKAIRAEPVVALYEKHRIRHCGPRGHLQLLEDEQTSWVPGVGDSPNRVDALVHGVHELGSKVLATALADPNQVLRDARYTNALRQRTTPPTTGIPDNLGHRFSH